MKILGISDEVTTCECCGKKNLKRTVVLTNGEGEVHYGSECAAKALRQTPAGRHVTKKDVDKMAERAEKVRRGEVVLPTRPSWGVVHEASGNLVVKCMTQEDAERGVAHRGVGYFVCRI